MLLNGLRLCSSFAFCSIRLWLFFGSGFCDWLCFFDCRLWLRSGSCRFYGLAVRDEKAPTMFAGASAVTVIGGTGIRPTRLRRVSVR